MIRVAVIRIGVKRRAEIKTEIGATVEATSISAAYMTAAITTAATMNACTMTAASMRRVNPAVQTPNHHCYGC